MRLIIWDSSKSERSHNNVQASLQYLATWWAYEVGFLTDGLCHDLWPTHQWTLNCMDTGSEYVEHAELRTIPASFCLILLYHLRIWKVLDTDLDKHLTEWIWTLPGAEAIISNRVNFALNLKGASPETRIVQLQLKQNTKEEFLSFTSDFKSLDRVILTDRLESKPKDSAKYSPNVGGNCWVPYVFLMAFAPSFQASKMLMVEDMV